jgi:anti-sigma B factor antagonist
MIHTPPRSNGVCVQWDPPRRQATPFRLSVVDAGRATLVRIQGPLDIEHAPHFAARVQSFCEEGRRIVVDLAQADYVDSSGVRALLSLKTRLDAIDGELRLIVPAQSRVRRTLLLLQLLEHFQVYPSAPEAWNDPREA